MAVGDTVIVTRPLDDPGPNPPIIGIVNAESGGPPITDADVIWRNVERSTVPITQLRKLFQAEDAAVALVGKWVQLKGFSEIDEPPDDGGPPKNPAASGVVLDAYGTGAYDAVSATANFIIISTEDGRRTMVLPFESTDPAFQLVTEQPGRRNV